MDSSPKQPPASTSPKRRLTAPVRITLALGLLLLVCILLLTVLLASDPQVVWLTPSDLSRPAHSTAYARFKYRVAVLVWPLIHNYWHGRPSIRTDATILTLSSSAMAQIGLGAPFATNSDGLHIWVLSAAELASFQQRIKTIPGVSILSAPRVQTADGRQAGLSTGGPTSSINVDVLPKITFGSIKLTISVRETESMASVLGQSAVTKTNLAAACRVLVPNAGGLIMDAGGAKDASGNSCWLIASPTAVDNSGNPVKL